MLPVRSFDQESYVVLATYKGIVKRLSLSKFAKPRSAGIMAVALDDGDHLIAAAHIVDNKDIMLFSNEGKVVRFAAEEIRLTGRLSRGVMGMRCKNNQAIVAMIVVGQDTDGYILTITQNGYGKQTPVEEYRRVARKSMGVRAMRTDEKTGLVVGAKWTITDCP